MKVVLRSLIDARRWRFCCIAVCALCLLQMLLPFGEAAAETIDVFGVSVDTSATSVDMEKHKINDLDELSGLLDRLPNLTRFDMYQSSVTRSGMAALAAQYPGVRFGWTIRFEGYRIRTDATAFSTLKDGSPPYFSSQRFNWLYHCKDLLALDLGHNSITDLSFLYDLPNLRVLILACNDIADLTPIASLKDLEYLELFKNNITDVTPLQGLTKLIDLNLCVNDIADASPLYGLTGLKRLWISRNELTDEQQAELRQKLPDTEINFDVQYATQGGWRTHERYQVIRKMFKKGVYQPWED